MATRRRTVTTTWVDIKQSAAGYAGLVVDTLYLLQPTDGPIFVAEAASAPDTQDIGFSISNGGTWSFTPESDGVWVRAKIGTVRLVVGEG